MADKEEYNIDLFGNISSEDYLSRLREMQKQILEQEEMVDKRPKENQIIAKMSYSLIKRKANDMVEMIIDDELVDMIEVLNKQEEQQRMNEQRRKQDEVIMDAMEGLLEYEKKQN